MITPSFGLTATERVLPKLALDFTTALLDSRITFARTGATATVVNSSGLIETVASDTPRFDYNPVTLACRGLLIEESRSNIVKYSADFSSWTKNNVAVSVNSIVAPDGTLSGDTVTCNAGTAFHTITSQAFTPPSGIATSIYVKAGTHSIIQLFVGGTATPYANFDLVNVTAAAFGGGTTAAITNAGNGWYRCIMVSTLTVATTFQIAFVTSTSSARAESWDATGAETIYLWGGQAEAGAFPTSYIPTTTAAVTRNADVATMTGTNFSDWFNPTEGTLLCRASRFANTATFPAAFQIDDGTDSNRLTLEIRNTTGTVFGSSVVGGATQAGLGSAAVGTNVATLAFAYKQDSFAFSHNGAAVLTDTSGNIPTVSSALIGSRRTSGASQFLNGHIQRISYYPQKLVNAEIQAITK